MARVHALLALRDAQREVVASQRAARVAWLTRSRALGAARDLGCAERDVREALSVRHVGSG